MSTTVDETTEPTETPDVETPETPLEGDLPEQTDEPGDEPDETPASPQEPAQPSEEAIEKTFAKAQKRADSYMKAVPDLLGSNASELSLCPRCTDFLPGFILPPTIKPVVGDQLVAVKLSIGEGVERPLKQDQRAFECGACGGEGKVLTGSHVRGQDRLQCEECHGRGWVGPRAATLGSAPVVPAANGQGDYEAPHDEPPQTDPWGRMRGDPLYGVMPGFES